MWPIPPMWVLYNRNVMKTQVEIKLTPQQIAEQIWLLDTQEIAEVFTEWNKIIHKHSEECRKNNKLNFWHTLQDVFLHMDNCHEMNGAFFELTRGLYVSSLANMGIISKSSKTFKSLTE